MLMKDSERKEMRGRDVEGDDCEAAGWQSSKSTEDRAAVSVCGHCSHSDTHTLR